MKISKFKSTYSTLKTMSQLINNHKLCGSCIT